MSHNIDVFVRRRLAAPKLPPPLQSSRSFVLLQTHSWPRLQAVPEPGGHPSGGDRHDRRQEAQVRGQVRGGLGLFDLGGRTKPRSPDPWNAEGPSTRLFFSLRFFFFVVLSVSFCLSLRLSLSLFFFSSSFSSFSLSLLFVFAFFLLGLSFPLFSSPILFSPSLAPP